MLVIAKAPVAGFVKTRLCPPFSPEQAAGIALAALQDTLETVSAVPDTDPLLVLDGPVGPWVPDGLEVIAQRGRGLCERLAAAFEDAGAPAFLVGMDTPQLTPALLSAAIERLDAPGVDAVLGLAHDGGWWGIGLCRSDPRVFEGVPMSTRGTGARQLARLLELELATDAALPILRDVDGYADALAVAAEAPQTRFASAVAAFRSEAIPGEVAR